MRKIFICGALGVLFATAGAFPARAQETRLRFSGFGDFVGGFGHGKYANPEAKQLFDQFGTDKTPVNLVKGFGMTGADFVVIADMTEKLTFLGELNFQASRGGSNELGLDVERLLVDYQIMPNFNVQGGLFFTPIGYNNRFLYARAWLMNSIQVPDFYEEELNLTPTHTIGVAGHGKIPLSDGHRINYVVSIGNSRPTTPEMAVYARDPQRSKMVTGLVEWLIPGFKDSRLGISGWNGNIDTFRVGEMGMSVNSADGERAQLREKGLDAFLVIEKRRWSLTSEYVHSFQHSRYNPAGGTYSMRGGMAEFAMHFYQRKLHPFLRYDQTSLPDGGGPYLSLRSIDDGVQRHYVPNFKAGITGAAYDINSHFRIKGEVIHHLDGPRQKWGVAFQGAFGF